MKENNELTRDDIAIDHDMEVDCDEGREIAVYIDIGCFIEGWESAQMT